MVDDIHGDHDRNQLFFANLNKFRYSDIEYLNYNINNKKLSIAHAHYSNSYQCHHQGFLWKNY